MDKPVSFLFIVENIVAIVGISFIIYLWLKSLIPK
ncbi:MAG: glutamyl-tRNA amidotransferase [Nautiliaceae bacterium]